uniref:NADH dehydrogenase subunit 2 n=1 Tax=Marcia hiantina TaxID=676960 RepID=UPI0022389604|nr:NADH dehydrogenase subunit 2 [Marcia hiantina]UYR95084.1 NADH dehydrogenase subunit 2 [Marcia hiantina]
MFKMVGVLVSMSSMCGLFFSVVGVVLSFVSVGLLGVWVGMELSFLSIICFASGSSVEETESMMKYFIIQVLGSCVCAMGFLMCVNSMYVLFSQFFILGGMMVKLGVFPFHFWVGPVVSNLSWAGCAGVLLLQKLIPLWVLSNYVFLFKDLSRVEFLCCATSLVGCVGGLNVLNYRVLLGFSSIQNLGPMVLLCCCQEFFLWVYVFVYMLVTGCFIMSLWNLSVYGFFDLVKENLSSQFNSVWWVSLYLFSSSGLPPFTGVVMKVSLLLGCWNYMPLGSGVCILSSCISLFFYLSVLLGMIVSWGKSVSFLKNKSSFISSNSMVLSLLINLSGGFIMFLCLSL